LDGTYNANREDATAVLPFAHATVRGFQTMVPPQAKPTHLLATGEVILTMASYGAVTFSGRATPMVIPVAESVWDWKQIFVSASQTLVEVAWAHAVGENQ
jgi:hypothetical protein